MYTRETFESKKLKRQLINKLIREMLSCGDRGSIVVLSGPAIEVQYNELKPLLRNKSDLLFVDNDVKMVKRERLIERVKKLNDPRAKFYTGDIWEALKECYVKKQGWKYRHVFFNLDFCCTASTLARDGLYEHLYWLAASKLPRRKGFWLAFTFCRWGDFTREWQKVPSKTIGIMDRVGWSLVISHIIPYAEKGENGKNKGGTNMVTMWFKFKWNNLKRRPSYAYMEAEV